MRRLADSAKMWTTLQKIAEAELADSSNQAADSITLRFLSLAPRVARLNQAVRCGLTLSVDGPTGANAPGAAEAADGSSSAGPSASQSRSAGSERNVRLAQQSSKFTVASAHCKFCLLSGNASSCSGTCLTWLGCLLGQEQFGID